VSVRIEEDLHVTRTEAEGCNVLQDLRGGLLEAAVDQDVAVRRREQERRDVRRADVVEICRDPERLDRLVPRA
jgi:hypothetical protein